MENKNAGKRRRSWNDKALLRLRPTALLPLSSRDGFLEHFFHQGALGGLFVPGHPQLATGEEVDLEITFATEQMTFHSRGYVRWKRLTDKPALPAGIGVEFLDNQRATRDLLLAFSAGKQVTLRQRRSRRFSVILDIEYATGSAFLSDITDDLSRDGVAIQTNKNLPIGTQVEIRLCPPGETTPINLTGEVRWNHASGRQAIGVRFFFKDRSVETKVNALVERIKKQVAQTLDFPAMTL